jgi:superfamily II DNA helicase RecQ
MLDEFHLFCQHGMDFRKEIRQISQEFIKVLMNRPKPPYLLACTATCSLHNVAAFQRMSGVDFNKKHRIVSPPEVFRQHNIEMRLDFTANYGTSINSKVIDFLKSNDDDGAFVIYTNTASLAKKLHLGLKNALNASDLPPVDILCVHGSQHALEKFHYTQAFCTNAVSKIHPELNIGGFLWRFPKH